MTKEELYQLALKNHYEYKELLSAEQYYKQLINEYPDSDEAKEAKEKLDSLNVQEVIKESKKLRIERIDPEYVILSTTSSVAGFKVTKTIEIITAECVFGMNLFKDFQTSLTDIFGGRSNTSQDILRKARKTCLSELKKEASLIKANAVIGVKMNYSEFSGQGKSMLFLVASGTAVVIEKLAE